MASTASPLPSLAGIYMYCVAKGTPIHFTTANIIKKLKSCRTGLTSDYACLSCELLLISLRADTQVHKGVCLHMHAHTYVHIRTHTHVHVHTHTHAHAHTPIENYKPGAHYSWHTPGLNTI